MDGRFVLTGGSAERIRDTIRTVESMVARSDVTALPTRFGEGAPLPLDNFRIGTFGTAAWSINSNNTVTLSNVGITGYTVLATNVFGSLPASGSTQTCAIAKDGTAWYLIQPFGSTASGSLVRRGTFSSPWATSETKTVTLLTGGTVAASNTLINYPAAPAGKSTVNCIVANESGTWFLANWEVVTTTASIVASMNTVSVVTDVSISASLNTSSCAITIGKTNTTTLISMVGSTYTTTLVKLA